mmetsp:Transcript_19008/g.31815  ORF Transcript_19008/g.31815 Transcript_19008/m.31815 type:complete len:361 (+) Transcript_19008:47-1129(+)
MTFVKFILIVALLCAVANAFHPSASRFLSRRPIFLATEIEETVSEDAPMPVENNEHTVHQVFIGNIPFDVEEDQLSALVDEKAGNSYKSLRLARDRRTGRSRGFGYLDFEDKSTAELTISALSGSEIDGRELKVDMSEPRPVRPRGDRPPQENSIFIGNLDFSIAEEQVLEMCNDILGEGVTTRVRLATDRDTGRPRGFGHIDFTSPEEATRAVAELSGVSLMGRDLRVDHARRKEDAPVGNRPFQSQSRGNRDHSLFLGNLAWEVNQELIEEMLDDVLGPGLFHQVRVAVDRETGRSRGFAHVDFKDAESAERALVELNGLEVLGRQLRVDMAQRKAGGGGGGGGGFKGSAETGSFGAF